MREAGSAMKVIYPGILALAVLAGCDGNPVNSGSSGSSSPSGPVSNTSVATLPGTDSPTASSSIKRYEAQDTPQAGNGYVTTVTYNTAASPANDTLTVDGAGFDGNNVYPKDATVNTAIAALNGYTVFDGPTTATDPVSGATITQFTYRALYGVSTSGKTSFVIVRTGQYTDYGFGGFIYQRNGSVTLPTSGQATYSGSYAGMIDYNGRSDLNYTTGDMTMSIDFRDFNNGNAVQGDVTNRKIYDLNGNDVTSTMVSQVYTNLTNDGYSPATMTVLPDLVFDVGPGVMDKNGELTGTVGSTYSDTNGAQQKLESGNYYAVMAGDGSTTNNEVVGVIVVTSTNSYYEGTTARETGGFILYR